MELLLPINFRIMNSRFKLGILLLISLTSCVKPLADTGVIEWDLSSLELPQMEYNGKIYYIHPDAGEMSYHEAVDYCKRLTAYNHSDWFLPGQQELSQMFEESSRIGGFMSGDYWFENPYARTDEERSMSYKGGVSDFGKARVRPVRCENTFTPTISLKQIHAGNWSTFEVTIPQSSRYTITKAGLCWSDKAGASSRIKIEEADKKEGTFYVSIHHPLVPLKTMYLSAFSELSDGRTVYSNEITLLPHEPIVDFTLERKDDSKVFANVTIKDWGFPENFEYLQVFLSDSKEAYSNSRKELNIKEDVFHYKEEWNMREGTLYLIFNPFSQASINVKATFSATIARE